MSPEPAKRTALVLGGTGLTGSVLIPLLLSRPEFSVVIDAGRRPCGLSHPALRFAELNFEAAQSLSETIHADVVFCSLGTTHRKAGGKAAFRMIDYEYVLRAAKAAKQNGCVCFVLVSSLGADAKSPVNYSKVKGELEDALKELQFPSLHIFRPSVLLGNRMEHRRGEKFMQWLYPRLSFLFRGPLRRYAGTPVTELASAMVAASLSSGKGVHIYEAEMIPAWAGRI